MVALVFGENIMTNVEEQQSGVVNQQSALTQTQNPERDILQQIQQQPEQKPQYNNIYQAISNSTPQQLMEMKGFAAKRQGRREIVRNVGSERGSQLIELVNSGEMSLKQALTRSKNELSPNMRKIDNLYFEDKSVEDFKILKARIEGTWKEQERNLYLNRYNAKLTKDDAAQTETNAIQEQVNKNNVFKRKAQVDYNYLTGHFQVPGQFFSDKITTEYSKATRELNQLMVQDVLEGNVTRADLNSKAVEIAKAMPKEYLQNRKGLIIGDDYIELPSESKDEADLRKTYAEALIAQIGKARDHLTNLDNRPLEELQLEQNQGSNNVTEVERKTSDGKTAIFNAETKEFIRYQENE